jgi:DNA-binding NarL/FixJ family response regulator
MRVRYPSHTSWHRTSVIRVIVADDHELVREGIAAILQAQPDIDVVGTAADGVEAVDLIRTLAPDVALMDIQMPHLDGVEATRRLIAAETRTRIIILTTFGHDEYVHSALRAGASGFLLKDTPKAALTSGVRAVAAGEATLDASVLHRLVDNHLLRSPDATPLPGLNRLTVREVEVLQLLAQGRSNEEIASSLHLSQSTVKTHIARTLTKLDARDRIHLAVLAHRHGLA